MIRDLIDRLEHAVEPDREIDAAIWLALVPGTTRKQWSYTHTASGRVCEVDETREASGRLVTVPAYTASLDAIMALYETLLPATSLDMSARRKGSGVIPAHARIWSDKPPLTFGDPPPLGFSRGHTPALALCRALLKALYAQEPESGAEV